MTILKKFNHHISQKTLVILFRQLATLISSEIPILQSFDILCQTQSNKTLRQLLTKIKTDLEAGHSLSVCFSKYPHYFDALTCQLIFTGEQSGTLPMTLDRISIHKEKLFIMKSKIKRAFIYPAFVLIVAFAVTLIMLTIVIPRFAELFQTMHGSLPVLTLTVIHLSHFICQYYWLSAFPLLTFIFFIHYLKRSRALQCKLERLIFQIPYWGSLYKKLILSRFSRSLAASYKAGVPISDSLNTIAYANGSHHYAQTILKLRTQILKGQQLHQAMQRQSYFPHLLIEMIKVGEESGTLDKMLEKIANIYESDIDHSVSLCGHLLEPLIIAILGVLIGGLVIAMYLPIFKLGTVI